MRSMGITMKRFILTLRLLFPILTSFLASPLNATHLHLDAEEFAVLNVFFKTLLEESEAGYVMLNQKPMCIHGFFEDNRCSTDSAKHKQKIAFEEGTKKLNHFISENKLKYSDIYIHLYKNIDPQIQSARHILIINIPLFHKVINENLPLFQHVLGPSINSQKILDAFIVHDCPFHSFLKYDNVLVGKILGYGTQSSIYGSRIEFIQKQLSTITTPFVEPSNLQLIEKDEFSPFKPNFGYQSLLEEYEDLDKNLEISSKKLITEIPLFGYGWLKNCKEENIIDQLEQTQAKIQLLLKSDDFLAEIFDLLYSKKINSDKSDFLFDLENVNKENTLAKKIFDEVKHYDTAFFQHFLDGLNGKFCERKMPEEASFWSTDIEAFKEAKANLLKATAIFKNKENDKNYYTAIPGKLCYKIKKPGEKETLSGNFVKVSYAFFSPDGELLNTEKEVLLNLKNTISGFYLGIKGMKTGEERKILIHPELSYGYEAVKRFSHVKAVVKFFGNHTPATLSKDLLTDEVCRDDKNYASNCEDLSFLYDDNYEQSIKDNYCSLLHHNGDIIRKVLLQDTSLDLQKLSFRLAEMKKSENCLNCFTPIEKSLSNKIFWNIYFNSKSKME